jgi:predicted ribosome quality control (RQC) complex YloA/Tae2 family protein
LPLDGIVLDCITVELKNKVLGGKIVKFFQPEKDEIHIHIHIRTLGTNQKLLLSANPSYPRIHLTKVPKVNPSNPPIFCMVLRKHLLGGRIQDIRFKDFERILTFEIESINELGDLSTKLLVIEIMGRHSNIILVDDKGVIIDSIKHVNADISRVREIGPGKKYILPPAQSKKDPLKLDIDNLFKDAVLSKLSIEKYLLDNIKGFSPYLCKILCTLSGIEGKTHASEVSTNDVLVAKLKYTLSKIIDKIKSRDYEPHIIHNDKKHNIPMDFHCLFLEQYSNLEYLDSINLVLDTFFSKKTLDNQLNQKKHNLVHLLNNHLEKCQKKLIIQKSALENVSDRESLKLYGELITAFIHSVPINKKKVTLLNYYSENNESVEIELNENKSPQENAQIYFKRYNKAKSTFYNAQRQLKKILEELAYLENVIHLLDRSSTLNEIDEIKEELIEQGYIKVKSKKVAKQNKAKTAPSKPFHYKSTDGFDIYVGKNNKQNDFLTFKFSNAKDMWLHVRNIPGSHTIIKCHEVDVPKATLQEAALIAAWHSKAVGSSNIAVDYTKVRHVKKPSGSKPGTVIYNNFKTIFVTPNENLINNLRLGW